jgi:hypothetical protein
MADLAGLLTPGVSRLRHDALTTDYCLDLCQLSSDAPHTYDAMLHPRSDTPVNLAVKTLMPIALPHHAPYATLRNAESAPIPETGATLRWSQSNLTVQCDLSTPEPAELIRAQWPTRSDHAGPWRDMFMLRTHAHSTWFLALYQLITPTTPPWKIATAQPHFNGHTHEFRITTSNSSRSHQHVFLALPV